MGPNQIMIMGISNGWLVTIPSNIQGQQPATTYCPDYETVCQAIKSVFPVKTVSRGSAVKNDDISY